MIPEWTKKWSVGEVYEILHVMALSWYYETMPAGTTLSEVWLRLDSDTQLDITNKRNAFMG